MDNYWFTKMINLLEKLEKSDWDMSNEICEVETAIDIIYSNSPEDLASDHKYLEELYFRMGHVLKYYENYNEDMPREKTTLLIPINDMNFVFKADEEKESEYIENIAKHEEAIVLHYLNVIREDIIARYNDMIEKLGQVKQSFKELFILPNTSEVEDPPGTLYQYDVKTDNIAVQLNIAN